MSKIIIYMYLLEVFFLKNLSTFDHLFSTSHQNYPPRTGPQELLVTHYECEENQQKTLNNYAYNQVTQCEPEPQDIKSTNILATFYSKARATTLKGYKFTAKYSEKKAHCSQVSHGNKNRIDHESFNSNIERLLHLNTKDCTNELPNSKITTNKAQIVS